MRKIKIVTGCPGYYQLLVQAQQALGDTGTAHLSMAEFYYQNGQSHRHLARRG